jgi:hypothetical protein
LQRIIDSTKTINRLSIAPSFGAKIIVVTIIANGIGAIFYWTGGAPELAPS